MKTERLEAELLLAHVLGWRRERVLGEHRLPLPERQARLFEGLLRRRLRREPLAYLLGEREFWSLSFKVSPLVMIPRPETELLVERALGLIEGRGEGIKLLDLGTGSGALAISLTVERAGLKALATDLSPAALALAVENATRHGVSQRIAFLACQAFEALSPGESFDFILSNPPYIPSGDFAHLEPEVRDWEPRAALDGGPDGLRVIEELIAKAPLYLKGRGWLIMEIGDGQGERVLELVAREGSYGDRALARDLAGRERCLMARKRGS